MSYPPRKSHLTLIEPLERRRLLSASLNGFGQSWGAIPRLVQQDLAVEKFPQITGSGQAVAVLDTGIDYNHPSLGGGFGAGFKVVGGYDFVDEDDDPMDFYGHGTAVAGVIAADSFTYSGARYQGVAPGAKLVALRVNGADELVPDQRIERALKWVISNRTRFNIVAVNVSFGSGSYADQHTSTYSDELATLKAAGVLIAASSGNSGVSQPFGVEYPAADPSVFSVGAVDRFDVITEYTARGKNLDLLAPGDDVPALSLGPGDVDLFSGTSFASPMVAGAYALMRQANAALRVADATSIFRAGGKDNVDGDDEFGTVTQLTFQRLNVHNAVSLALARKPATGKPANEIATAGNGNDVAYDGHGVLHVVYYDSINKTLKYATRGSDRGALSAANVIDNSGDDVGGYVSIAIDATGRPGVAYFNGTRGDLRFARFDGAAWQIDTLDSAGSTGLYPSIVYDADDRPVISYFQKTRGDLRVARFDGSAWSIQTVDSKGVVGRSTDLTLNRRTGELAIAYEDSDRGRLKVARNSGSGWTRGLVDHDTLGVTHASIAFGPDDQPAVSYYDIHRADLKYARFDGQKWNHQRLAHKGAQGLYTQLYFAPDGKANILYYNRRNNLVVKLSGDFDNWSPTILQSGGGRYVSAAVDSTTQSVTYTWFEPGVAKLRLAEV